MSAPIFIVKTAYENYCCTMDNNAKDSLHYSEDKLSSYLSGTASQLEFKTSAIHNDSKYLIEGNKIAFEFEGNQHDLVIVGSEMSGGEVTITAYSSLLELLYEDRGAYSGKNMALTEYLRVFDPESVLTIGVNEVVTSTRTNEWTGTESMYARISSLATLFDAEVQYTPILDASWKLTGLQVDFLREHSSTVQGVGEDRRNITRSSGYDFDVIKKTASIEGIYTAIKGTGADGISIKDIERQWLNENNEVEFFTKKGSPYIYAPLARDKYPSNLMAKNTERYIGYDAGETEYKTSTYLLTYLYTMLKSGSEPVYTYTVEGDIKAGIGDTVRIQDNQYDPPLILDVRVTETVKSLSNSDTRNYTISNATVVANAIDPKILNRLNALIAQNTQYSSYIISNDGILFKNGKGIITLTASVRNISDDVTDELSIVWYKDGTQVSTYKTITIQSSSVTTKALFTFKAFDTNGTLKGQSEVTVTNVNDGTSGSDGAPGKDGVGLQSTDITYAIAASGITPPVSGWSAAVPTIAKGFYLWTKTVWTYTDRSTETGYTVAYLGKDGNNGADGLPGKDGVGIVDTDFLYASGNSGVNAPLNGWTLSIPTVPEGSYLWTKTTWNYTDGTSETAYTVALMGKTGAQGVRGSTGPKGDPGETGADGLPGKDGVGISDTNIQYASSPSGTIRPTSGWSTGIPAVPAGSYLWTRTTLSYTDASSEDMFTVSRIGKDGNTGADGIAGKDGVGLKSTSVQYGSSSSGTTAPTSGWNTSVPDIPDGLYLWTKTTWYYTDNTSEVGYSVSKIGEKGERGLQGLQGTKGDQGIQGPKGATGSSSYTHIAYANNSTGTSGFSLSDSSNKTYIGMYVDSIATDSTTASNYKWTLIKGAAGSQGIQGPKGADGQTPYLHTAYATSADGTSGFSTTVSSGKTYIGLYTDYTATDSTDPTKYSWTLVKGDTGPQGLQGLQGTKGDQGIQGPKGTNGISSYTHIAYSTNANGTAGFSTSDSSGKTYIGMYVDSTATDSTDPTKYKWSLIKGADGSQGIQGPKGADGQTPYLHIAYATNATGTSGFSTTDSSGKTYIGTYTDYTATDSTTASKYTWVLIKGEQGPQGIQGLQGPKGDQGIQGPKGTNGISSYTHIAYSTNATGTSGFSTSDPTNKTYIGMYVDNKSTDSTKPSDYKWTLIKGSDGTQGIQGPKGSDGQTPYLHIAYATNATGSAGFSTTSSTGKTYIGTYTDYNSADSTDYTKYTWMLIKGDKGDKGDTGATGPKGDKGDTGDRGATGPTGPAGAGAVSGYLSNEAILLNANSSGVVTNFSNANGTFVIYNGQNRVNSGVTYSLVSSNGVTTSINSSGAYSVTAISASVGTAIFRAVYGSATVEKILTVAKAQTGATGAQGNTGPQGPKGNTGDSGSTGPQGAAGAKGDKGDKGDRGSTGPQGAAGAKGDKGDKGDRGYTGDKGDPTGIVVSDYMPSQKYTNMLWKHTGSISGFIKNATYRWTGNYWDLYLFSAANITVDTLSAIATNTGVLETYYNADWKGKLRIEGATFRGFMESNGKSLEKSRYYPDAIEYYTHDGSANWLNSFRLDTGGIGNDNSKYGKRKIGFSDQGIVIKADSGNGNYGSPNYLNSGIELIGKSSYIDFHDSASSTDDYKSRIIHNHDSKPNELWMLNSVGGVIIESNQAGINIGGNITLRTNGAVLAQNTNMSAWVDVRAKGFVQSSAYSLKTNFKDLSTAELLEAIDKTDIVEYQFKDDVNNSRPDKYIGMILNDDGNSPYSTSELLANEDNTAFNTTTAIGVMMGSIKELSKQNKELSKQNKDLQAKVDTLYSLIESIDLTKITKNKGDVGNEINS